VYLMLVQYHPTNRTGSYELHIATVDHLKQTLAPAGEYDGSISGDCSATLASATVAVCGNSASGCS